MANYLEKKDEEDIWEELRQMLLNPPSEQEIALKKQEEQAKIDAALEKMFPDVEKPKTEPYLEYDDLFDKPKTMVGEPTGMAAPMYEGSVAYEKHLTPYEQIDSKKDWSDELKAQKKAEVAKIEEAYEARNKEINREHVLEQAKNYGGAALEIGSAFVPEMLGSKVARGAIKTTKPLIEQIVKKNITRGGVEGLASGAMSGLGQGMLEDENLLKSSVIGGLTGGTVGSALGKISGEVVANTPNIKNLDELLDKRKDWGIAFTKQSGKPAEAIDKLLEQKQGFVPKATNKEGIGDIDFVYGKQDYNTGQGYGLEHIIDGRTRKNKIDGVEYVKSLPETFNNGVVTRDNRYPNHNYIEDLGSKIAIPNNWLGKERNWVLTAHPQNKSASKRLAASAPMSKPNVDSRYNNFTTELTADNNIITNSNSNLNPSQSSIQKPLSHNEWLEELKRRRKKGWW